MPVTINASTSSGLVQSADNSGQIELQTNGTTVATVNTSNNVQFRSSISVGNVTPTTSGAGITFPATQSASTDANTLDDYEEGTWTPGWLNFGTGTYNTREGKYTKIGRLVTVECFLAIQNIGSAAGIAAVTGLPFAPGSGVISVPQMWTNNWASSGQNIVGLSGGGSTQVDLFIIPASSGVTQATMSNMTNASNIVFFLSYAV